MKRRLRLLAGGWAVALVVSACGPSASDPVFGPDGRRVVSLQLNWFPEPEFGGYYEAERLGLYREADLDVRLLTGGPSVPAVQLVASGRAEFGIAAGDELVTARAQGVPIVALFAVYQTSPTGIMVRADSGIKDLAGVFAPRDPKLTLALMNQPYVAWLKQRYDFSNVRQVMYQGGVSQFVRDPDFAQQCFVTTEPFAAKGAGVPARAFLVAESGFNPYEGVVITREDFLEANEATVRRFLAATRRGWERYLADPTPANEIMLPLNPGERAETFDAAANRQLSLIRSSEGIGRMTRERWATLIDQLLKIEVIDRPVDAAGCFAPPAGLAP